MFKHVEQDVKSNIQRKRQIDTLKIFNDNVSEINENKFSIKFKSGQRDFTLFIELDAEFPFSTPKLYLEPSVQHQWIQNHPGILNFSVNSDLGRVCQAIIRKFEKNPPELSTSSNLHSHPQSVISELNELDTDQLKALLDDEQYLDDFIENLPPVRSLNAELDALIEESETLAIQNLEKESDCSELKSSVHSLSVEFISLGQSFNEKSKKYNEKSDEYLPENIRQLLEIGVANAESQCEEYVQGFLNGDQSIKEFLDNFMETKKLIAMRKFKEERLNYQLNQLKL